MAVAFVGSTKAVLDTGVAGTSVTVTRTLTAGNTIIVTAGATQSGGGTRTLTISDGTNTYTVDSSTGALATPSYVWSCNITSGGSKNIVITVVGGNAIAINATVDEFSSSGTLVRASGGAAGSNTGTAITNTTVWSSGNVVTGETTGLLWGAGFVTNRADTTLSSATDGNSNSYTVGQQQTSPTSGENVFTAYRVGSLASATEACNGTVSANSTGRMHFVPYKEVASAVVDDAPDKSSMPRGLRRGLQRGIVHSMNKINGLWRPAQTGLTPSVAF